MKRRLDILSKCDEKIHRAGFKDVYEVEACIASVEKLRPSINKLRLLQKLVTSEHMAEVRQARADLELKLLSESTKPEAVV